MSVVDLSLGAVTEDLICWNWPVLVGLVPTQVLVTRRVLSGGDVPTRSSVVAASVASVACCAAIALDMVSSAKPLPQDEPGFSFVQFMWSLFTETMWPVLAAFGVAQLLLLVFAGCRSLRVLSGISFVSSLTAGWMIAWWFYLGSHSEAVKQIAFSPMPWLIGVLACGAGLVLSTTTLLIAKRTRFTFWKTTRA